MLTGLIPLIRTQWRLIRREPGYWITSIGLAALIVVVYGSVFSNAGGPSLGAVLQDDDATLAAALDELAGIDGIDLERGSLDSELAAMEDGDRWAVIVFPEGTVDAAREGRPSRVQIIYNDASPYQATAGIGVLREFVTQLNEGLGVGADLGYQERTIEARRGAGLLEVLFPGLVGMSLMFGNTLAAGTFVTWRQFGILRRISSSPIRPLTLELSQFMTLAVLSSLQVTVLVALAHLLFGIHVAGSYLTLAVVCAAGAVMFMGIWYALAALVTNTLTFFATMNLTAFIMVFLGGSVVPNDDAPSWLQPVIQALPLTHLNDALRGVINEADGLEEVSVELAILGAWAVAAFVISGRLFRWDNA